MSADHRFEVEPRDYDGTTRPRSKWTTCLIGCLVVLGVMLVLAILVGIWVARNWRGWFADFGSQAVQQAINESELPPQEKQDIMVQVDRVAVAFREGRLSFQQLGLIMQKLAESPLMPSFVVMAVEKNYFDKSGLSEEEKAEGRKSLQRFARGSIDGKIDEKAIDGVLSHIADRQPDGNWALRAKVSDDDLRAALSDAKAKADEAAIPEQPATFDPSDEFKKVIDEAMKEPQQP